MTRPFQCFRGGLLLAAASVCLAQPAPTAFTGARLIPISGPEIDRGVLVIADGRIVAAGREGAVQIPANAARVDASGKVIMPGLIDSHSHIGEPEGGDASAPIHPDVRVLDSINVLDAHIEKALAGGVTTVNVMPGSGHLFSGQTLYLKLRRGRPEAHRRRARGRLRTRRLARIRDRIDAMYVDKLDGRIDTAFFDRRAAEWRAEQDRLLLDVETHQGANQTYIEEGV